VAKADATNWLSSFATPFVSNNSAVYDIIDFLPSFPQFVRSHSLRRRVDQLVHALQERIHSGFLFGGRRSRFSFLLEILIRHHSLLYRVSFGR
jgi:hypothetical protein